MTEVEQIKERLEKLGNDAPAKVIEANRQRLLELAKISHKPRAWPDGKPRVIAWPEDTPLQAVKAPHTINLTTGEVTATYGTPDELEADCWAIGMLNECKELGGVMGEK